MTQSTGKKGFSERLRRERRLKAVAEDRDIENQEIAEALGFDAATVGRWFLGKSMPRDDATMEVLAAYFGVTRSYLRYGEGDRVRPLVVPESKRDSDSPHPPASVATARPGGKGATGTQKTPSHRRPA